MLRPRIIPCLLVRNKGLVKTVKFGESKYVGDPINGLYAIGQNGLGGQILWGHGLHIAWAMTSGRLVGRVLADSNS